MIVTINSSGKNVTWLKDAVSSVRIFFVGQAPPQAAEAHQSVQALGAIARARERERDRACDQYRERELTERRGIWGGH